MPPKGPGRSRYGKTWWGGKFLDAFNGIDFSNRLPRGVTYANNGSCSEIKVERNIVSASVQGSDWEPYRVKVVFHDFSAGPSGKAIDGVLEGLGPVIVSRLANRELPESLLQELEQKNIRLFPRTWGDVGARCTCPDSAVPCKHIAAVIFLTAAEIDKNPFLVFELHNYNLQAKLGVLQSVAGIGNGGAGNIQHQKSGLNSKGGAGSSVGSTGGAFKVNEVPNFIELIQSSCGDDDRKARNSSSQPTADVSKLNVDGYLGKIQDILKMNPLFFPKKDFREFLLLMYRHWGKRATGGSDLENG